MTKRKGVGRGLEAYEVALIKNMRERAMTRDYIMSMIMRPGRVLSPAAVDDVMKGRIGPDIRTATDVEADLFIRNRLSTYRPLTEDDLGGPASPTVVRELLRTELVTQGTLSVLESNTIEFKGILPNSNELLCAVARTMAAFANASGGYVIFGVNDNRKLIGLADDDDFAKKCDQISDIATQYFCPEISWTKNLLNYDDLDLGVIYVYPASIKPIVAMREGNGIGKSMIYYRYVGKSQRIEPGDLLHLLHLRDRATAATTMADTELRA